MNKKMVLIFVWGGIVSLLIAPLCLRYVDTNIFFPYITGKNFFWRFFIELAVVFWASAALLDAKYRISVREPLFIALASFMGIVLLANLLGHNPYHSFWSSAERMDGYISLLHLFGYFIALIGLIRKKVWMERMIMFLLCVGIYIAWIGWGQDKERIDSTLGNPIYLASLSFFGIFISGYFLVAKEKFFNLPRKVRLVVFSLAALAFLYTIFRTGTRGALLGIVAGGFTTALITAVWAREHQDRIWRYLAAGFVLLTLIAGGLFFGAREQISNIEFVQDDVLLSRLVRVSTEDRTTGFRLANWNMAIEGFKERPLLGWGQEHYTPVFSKYYDVESLYNAEQWYDRVHNTFLDWLVFAGMLGLISYSALFIACLYLVWKKSRMEFLQKCVMTGLLVGYLFQNLVAFDSLVSGIFLYAVFALILSTTREKPSEDENDLKGERTFTYIIIGLIVCTTGAWMYHSIYIPQKNAKTYISFIRELGPRPTPEISTAALPTFASMFEPHTFMNQELTLQAINQKNRYLIPQLPPAVLQQYVAIISNQATNAFIAYNHPTKLHLIYGTFLGDLQVYEQSLIHLNQAHKQSPKKLHILLNKALVLEKIGQIQAAEQNFTEATKSLQESERLLQEIINLAPEYDLGQRVYRDFLDRHSQ